MQEFSFDTTNQKQTKYYDKLDDKKVKCLICANECQIKEGHLGRCGSRYNNGGDLFLSTHSVVSSLAVDPIEKKPLYHFYPGTRVFSLGSWGCNFSCLHCQNWEISQPGEKTTRKSYQMTPFEAVELAIQNNSQGICWTYNEPAIWFEYTLESAVLAKEKGLYTAYVTNGLLNSAPLKEIAPFLDAYRVDFKGFSDKLYKDLCGISQWKKIYDNTVLAKELGIHIETVTNIVQGYNDDAETLHKIARFIAVNLGTDTPWHVSRSFPNHQLPHIVPTPMETINKAVQIGYEEGLNFIYHGNCSGKSDTICPDCKTLAITRAFPVTITPGMIGNCTHCGRNLNIKM